MITFGREVDDITILSANDKYGREIVRGTKVVWASYNGHPKLSEGIVLGFTNSECIVGAGKNKKIKKSPKHLVAID